MNRQKDDSPQQIPSRFIYRAGAYNDATTRLHFITTIGTREIDREVSGEERGKALGISPLRDITGGNCDKELSRFTPFGTLVGTGLTSHRYVRPIAVGTADP